MTDVLEPVPGAPIGEPTNTTNVTGSAPKEAADQAARKVREIGAKVQKTADKAASQLSDRVSQATERTVEAYDVAAKKAKQVAETVDPFVRERPYAAIGAVLGVGVVIGMLLAARSPKVIYIKPRV
ncbi:DUF883 family protein [Phenylobacterium immobile]|uniref:DUF883 family protein n=1 Tax=Phenylobacterium immobile TaxID=21 RepID=UPI000B02E55D|nr:DUF883 family protein [Phenylobacterium immobile]